MNIRDYIKQRRALIDEELERLLPAAQEYPQLIHRAIRYAIQGGKRIRPILCLASAELFGAAPRNTAKTACAIEMIHTYSLIHDDLPSMDDDDLRRGRATCHKKFGEACAILTGDALLTLGFGTLAEATEDARLNTRIITELAQACGTFGMIGGQVVDVHTHEKDLPTLEYINIHKTGLLIAASCTAGAIAARADAKQAKALCRFGEYIGLVFQIVDDILDSDGVAGIYGAKRAYQHAVELAEKAKKGISRFGKRSQALFALADIILKRTE